MARLQPRISRNLPPPVRRKREGMSATHRANIHDLLCATCGKPGPEVHHLMKALPQGERGMGRKAADRWAIPLCHGCHRAVHDHGNDEVWLAEHGIQGRELASALWAERDSLDGMIRVLLRALQVRMRREVA